MHYIRTRAIKMAVIFLIILVVSAGMELFYFNYHAIRYGNVMKMDVQSIQDHSTGFALVGDKLVPTEDNASITYDFSDNYYSKLIIDYDATEDNTMKINLGSHDSAGAETVIPAADTYSQHIHTSYTYLGIHIHSVNIVFPSQLIAIRSISLVNQIDFNIFRFIFMTTTGMLFAFIIFSKKILAERIEVAFLVTAISIGMLMVLLLPLRMPVTWDDDTHFQRIYDQSFFRVVNWTPAAHDFRYFQVPVANTFEERQEVNRFLNSENDFSKPVTMEAKSLYIPYTYRCYIPQSSMMALGRGLDLSFTNTQALSRIGGLLFYSFIVFAAISMAKFGKRIIAAIALMPTPLFMAANFCYDPFVICLSILAFVVFSLEYFDKDKKIGLRNMAIFLAATILASCTKAVYIPMILVAFLLPLSKFQSKKHMYMFRLGITAIFLTIMATFVLPTVINPATTGDLRGGLTSISGQLHFIIHDPLFYGRLLMKSIWDTLGSFFLGSSSYVNFAYLGISSNNCSYISIFVILFAVFTDAGKDDTFTFKRSSKLYIIAIIFSVMCLIWTALYLAFTPVGMNQINGVQSRYYIPLAVPLLFLLRSSKIETKISPVFLNRIVIGCCAFIGLFSIYDYILKPFNF